MTLTERAREILDGVTGVNVEGDLIHVRSKLANLVHEAMCEVCFYCKEKIPVEQLGKHSFVHGHKGEGAVYCMASPIRKMLEE